MLWKIIRVVVMVLLGVAVAASGYSCHTAQAAISKKEVELRMANARNDSTTLLLTSSRKDNAKLMSLMDVKDKLNGELIAAVRLKVPRRDTVIVHDSIPTEVKPDSTRVAIFRDSLKTGPDSVLVGVVSGTITAPPCCVPLALTYKLERPEFHPAIGFVRVGQHIVATVVWQGERVEIESAYADVTVPPSRIRVYTDLLTSPLGTGILGAVEVRGFWGLSGVAQVSQRFQAGEALRTELGIRKVWWTK